MNMFLSQKEGGEEEDPVKTDLQTEEKKIDQRRHIWRDGWAGWANRMRSASRTSVGLHCNFRWSGLADIVARDQTFCLLAGLSKSSNTIQNVKRDIYI